MTNDTFPARATRTRRVLAVAASVVAMGLAGTVAVGIGGTVAGPPAHACSMPAGTPTATTAPMHAAELVSITRGC